MRSIIILLIIIGIPALLLVARLGGDSRKKSESKLSVLEHPSTFKKPDIEMVTKVEAKQNDLPSVKNVEFNSGED